MVSLLFRKLAVPTFLGFVELMGNIWVLEPDLQIIQMSLYQLVKNPLKGLKILGETKLVIVGKLKADKSSFLDADNVIPVPGLVGLPCEVTSVSAVPSTQKWKKTM